MRDCLLCGGIDRALSTEPLEISLTRANQGGCLLSKHVYQETAYYHPKSLLHVVGTPTAQQQSQSGQRVRSPPRNHFLTVGTPQAQQQSQLGQRVPNPPSDNFLSDKVPSATNINMSNLNLALMKYENTYFEYERELADQDEDVGREAGEDEITPNDAYAPFNTPTKDQDETVEGGILDDAWDEVDPTFETPTEELTVILLSGPWELRLKNYCT